MRTMIAAAIVLSCVGGIATATPPEDMSSQLKALQQRLEAQEVQIGQLRQSQDKTWLDERRAEQVKQLIHEVLNDADTRASLLDEGLTAGWKNNFYLSSPDGNFLLKILGQIQFRYVFNTQDDTADGSGDDNRGGFELSRVRFGFKGHIIDPSWQFFIWTGHGSTGGYLPLDVHITKKFDNGMAIQMGQFKVPLWKEWLVSETRQQFVERSLLTYEFWGLYTEGVNFIYKNDKLSAVLSLNDGLSTSGGNLGVSGGGHTSPWYEESVEGLGVTGRLEYLLTGNWKQTADFQSWQGEDTMVMLGGAFHWQQGEYGTGTDEAEIFRWTVDASVELGGCNLFGAIIGNHVSGISSAEDVDQYGFLVQAGHFLTEKWEIMARYEWGDSDIDGESDLSIMTVGVNYFVKKHAMKFTADVGYAFNSVSDTWASDGAGWREDTDGEDGQIVLRAQVQLLF